MDIITNIKTKADAMAFGIEQSEGDLGKADQIYRMFVDNMELPDTETTAANGCFKKLEEATEALTRRIAERLSEKAERVHVVYDKSTQPRTLILPGMPHLEWMTENLSGFGGTEVNGHWYYTWEEAMAAAEQLGNGWRLPTREEFVQLCDLGSTWDDERKGRWFGGNHATDHKGSLFFPAAGFRNASSGALLSVGTSGFAWSSSPHAAGLILAGHLGFDATVVRPLNGYYRAYGFPVRCVRNVK